MSDNSSDSSSDSDDGGGVSLLETVDSTTLVPRYPRDEPLMQSTSVRKPESLTPKDDSQSTKPPSTAVLKSLTPPENLPANLQAMVTPATNLDPVSNGEAQNNNDSRSEESTPIGKSPDCGPNPPAKTSEPPASTNDVHQIANLCLTIATVTPPRERASTWAEMENRALAASASRKGYASRILAYLIPNAIRESWGRIRHQTERRQIERDDLSDDYVD